MEIFNKSVCLPVLHFASKYSRALKRNLLVYQREKEEEKRREEHLARRQEQAAQLLLSHRGEGEEKKEEAEGENKEKEEGEDKKKEGIDPFDTDDWFDSEDEEEEEIFAKQLLEFDKALLSSSSSSSSASFPSLLQREGEDEKEEEEEEERDTPIRIGSNYPPRWEREIWRGWRKIFKIGEEEEGESEEEREKRQKLRIDAVKRILHPAMGPALIDGSFFRPLPPLGAFPSGSEEEEEQIASLTFPSFATLTELARRLPDAVVIFTSSDEAASKRAIDFALIEKLAEEDMRKKLQIQEEKKKRKENRDRRRAAAEALGEDFEEEEEEEEEDEDEDEEEEASTFDPVVAAGKKASLQALEEFKRRKKVEEKILLQSAKLFAANRVPVLVINGDRGVDTVQRAITHFLKPFLVHRQSLFLSSQCIPLD
ncbi:adenylate kinase, partial [Cystoisospora suis]